MQLLGARCAELYAVISMVNTAAHMLSSQLWTCLLIFTLHLEGPYAGLPFWVSAGVGLLTFSLMLLIQWSLEDVRNIPAEQHRIETLGPVVVVLIPKEGCNGCLGLAWVRLVIAFCFYYPSLSFLFSFFSLQVIFRAAS